MKSLDGMVKLFGGLMIDTLGPSRRMVIAPLADSCPLAVCMMEYLPTKARSAESEVPWS